MITKLAINDFKCIDKIELNLANLNLLVGTNSAGKSSVIQALLLAIQNNTYKRGSTLNGHLVSIGTFTEARNYIKNAKCFSIFIENDDHGTAEFTFREDEKDSTKCKIVYNKPYTLKNFLNYEKNQVHYLSARRIGYEDTYKKNFDKYDEFGLMGEFVMDYFEKHKNSPVFYKPLIKDSSSQTLGVQVNYWLNYILNTELSTEDLKGTDNIRAQYSYKNTRPVRPKNIGTGLSYMISILIMGLSCKANDIIIIENPEIHLHPKAQSLLSDFFVFLSTNKIQLIIESHSDHIFNGIRKAISKQSITPAQTSINFFSINNETLMSQHARIELTSDGKVKNHVDGLFDQFDADLDILLGLL